MTPNGRDEFEARVADAETHLSELTDRLRAVERERSALALAIARVRSVREDTGTDPARRNRRMAFVDADAVRVRLGYPEGARVERIVGASPAAVLPTVVRDPLGAVPRLDARETERAAVWREIDGGARVVFVWGSPGCGATTLLTRMAIEAPEHGLIEGAVFLRDVRGDLADVAARVAGEALGTARRFSSFAELRRRCFGRRLLVLLDTLASSSADVDELCAMFPSFRFAASVSVPPPGLSAVQLGALAPTAALALIADGYGAPVLEGEERDAALRLCAHNGLLPDPAVRLGRIAARSGRSFRALESEYGEAAVVTIAALAQRAPIDAELLAWTQAAGSPLPRGILLAVVREATAAAALDGLIEDGFLRDDCGNVVLPADVARAMPPDPQRADRRSRLLDVLTDRCAAASEIVDARTLATAEALLVDAFESGWWEAVVRASGAIGERCAEQAAFGAWGRVLNLAAAAAKRTGDDATLARVYHDLAARALACGDLHDATAYARTAIRERARIGDLQAERASRELLAAIPADGTVVPEPPVAAVPPKPATPAPQRSAARPAAGDAPPLRQAPAGPEYERAAAARQARLAGRPATVPSTSGEWTDQPSARGASDGERAPRRRAASAKTPLERLRVAAAGIAAAIAAALVRGRASAAPKLAELAAAFTALLARLDGAARARLSAVRTAATQRRRPTSEVAAAPASAGQPGVVRRRAARDANGKPAAVVAAMLAAVRQALAGVPPDQRLRMGAALGGVVAIALGVVLVAALTGPAKPRHLAITEATVDRPLISAGGTAQICVQARDASYLAIIPGVGSLPPAGRRCVTVAPTATTTYVIAAADPNGTTARQTVTVAIRQPSRAPRITSFTAPARLEAGKTAQLCYAVDDARLLRIVPSVGPLTRLRACRSVRLTEPHGYRYELVAIGSDGRVASRTLRIAVVPPRKPAAAPATPSVLAATLSGGRRVGAPHAVATPTSDQVALRAIYQFDVRPQVLEHGQAASLCVGVGSWARGRVSGIGSLTPGLTRCYRVSPAATTTYHLHVSYDHSVADEAVTVRVRRGTRAHEVARADDRAR